MKNLYFNERFGWVIRVDALGIRKHCRFRLEALAHFVAIAETGGVVLSAPKGNAGSLAQARSDGEDQYGRRFPMLDGNRAWMDELDYERLASKRWYYKTDQAWWVRYDPREQRFIEESMENCILETDAEVFHLNPNSLDNRRISLSLQEPPRETQTARKPFNPWRDFALTAFRDPHGPDDPES